MSDRQFFPCKCGYQVCMWCWHRIRESESGLCPACRTPYGDDPHEFSAVDMEEVVKANKEKAAAEKRERERLRQQQQQLQGGSTGGSVSGSGVISSASSVGSSSSGYFSSGTGLGHIQSSGVILEGEISGNSHGSSTGISGSNGKSLDPPKDRNQLANMRVIRRNLVYAVGLPPPTATEDALRRSEYFGQYGKITKIVLNRNHNGNGDPRRASASAYVTFAHKVSDWWNCFFLCQHIMFHHLVISHLFRLSSSHRRMLWHVFLHLMVFIWMGEIFEPHMAHPSIALPSSRTYVAIIQIVHTFIIWGTAKTLLPSKKFKLDM